MIFVYIALAIIIAGTLFVNLAPQWGKKPFGEHLNQIKKSAQHTGKFFENSPKADPHFNLRNSFGMLVDLFRGSKKRRPKSILPSYQPTFDKDSGAYLTWFGHSTFLYEIDGKRILFDPMLGRHASPLPGIVTRYPYTLPSRAKDLPHLDAVIISHDHYDHLDYGTIQILKNKVDRFVMPLGVGSHLVHWGIPKEKIIELDWWGSTMLGDIQITSTPSQHFSGRAFTDRKQTLWSAFAIKNKTANVFFGGDSGYFSGFKAIGDKLGPFDLTLLDSGQYNARWQEVHMFPEQSVIAHKELRGKVFMPIHWSAFTLSLHSWTDPAERAVKAVEKDNIEIVTPKIGERFNILTERPSEKWWRNVL